MPGSIVLITGGAGFIGSRLTAALSSQAEKVVVFDNLHPQVHGDNAEPPTLPSNTVFVRGDVTDKKALSAVVEAHKPTLIYHLAAETGTGQSYDEPARYCDVNVMGTTYLIEAVRAHCSEAKARLVLAGSRAVYGEGAYRTAEGALIPGPARKLDDLAEGRFVPLDQNRRPLAPAPTPEALATDPASVYASSKLMQEFLFSQCAAEGDFEVVLLRFQNVYGPGQSLKNPYTGVLSIFANQILDGRTLNIYEDGDIVRDFVFVDDVVDALVKASNVAKPPEGPVNIGSAETATIKDTAQMLLTMLGADPNRFEISGDYRPGDIRYAVADISKAKKALGWTPATSLKDGLAALADWVKSERN